MAKNLFRYSASLLILFAYGEIAAEEIPTRYPSAPRVVAIGDVHGDLGAARRALRLAGAIDEEDKWIGGELALSDMSQLQWTKTWLFPGLTDAATRVESAAPVRWRQQAEVLPREELPR